MSVSLTYQTLQEVPFLGQRQIQNLITEMTKDYRWWNEGIWLGEDLRRPGIVAGASKLFCLIDDPLTDTHMAMLDAKEIVRILTTISQEMSVQWEFGFDGDSWGRVTSAGPDSALKKSFDSVQQDFPGDFGELNSMSRDEILALWHYR